MRVACECKVDMPVYKKSKEEKKWPRMQIVNQKEKKAPCVTTASVGDGGRPEPAEEVPLECVPLLSLFLSAHPSSSRLSLLRCCVADPTKCMHVMSSTCGVTYLVRTRTRLTREPPRRSVRHRPASVYAATAHRVDARARAYARADALRNRRL